jgi:predicted DCC family thiol-disulfide oxidoreductase YuxK
MNLTDANLAGISGPIVLYDGICGLCESTVNFIIDHDPKGLFHFAPLQSEIGRRLLSEYGLQADVMDTMVLLDDGKAYFRSSAALRIGMLIGHWPALLAETLMVIPQPLRDAAYRRIARHRYRWFGKRDACRVPMPGIAARFL